MTPREYVLKAMKGEKTDVCPYWLMGLEKEDSELALRLDAHYGSRAWRDKVIPYISGGHIAFINDTPENGFVRDTFGVLLQEGNIMHPVEPKLSAPTLDGFAWPRAEAMFDWQWLENKIASLPDSFQLWGLAMGLFERSWFLRGIENVLVDMIEDAEFVNDLLDGIVQVHMDFMDCLSKLKVDAIFGGDDVCDQRGVIMGLERWRVFFKPRLKKLIDHAHALGLPYILHSCGNVLPLVDDLVEIGLDGLESLQAEAMDIFELKRRAAGGMLLIGGMGVQQMMYSSAPHEITQYTKRLYREMGKGGGYVLAPCKNLFAETTERAAAFIDALLEG